MKIYRTRSVVGPIWLQMVGILLLGLVLYLFFFLSFACGFVVRGTFSFQAWYWGCPAVLGLCGLMTARAALMMWRTRALRLHLEALDIVWNSRHLHCAFRIEDIGETPTRIRDVAVRYYFVCQGGDMSRFKPQCLTFHAEDGRYEFDGEFFTCRRMRLFVVCTLDSRMPCRGIFCIDPERFDGFRETTYYPERN